MNAATRTFGNRSEPDPRVSACSPVIAPLKGRDFAGSGKTHRRRYQDRGPTLFDFIPGIHTTPRTVQDLLAAIQQHKPQLPVPMLQTTAGHISTFLNTPVEELAIDALADIGPEFRDYLRERRYKRNSVRSYSNFLSLLLRIANEFGWDPQDLHVPEAWKTIFAAMPRDSAAHRICRYAIRHRKAPSDFCDADLDAWEQQAVSYGRSYSYTRGAKSEFRHLLSTSGLLGLVSGVSCSPEAAHYGVPLRSFPRRLRTEVEALLKWKQDLFAAGRPRHQRLRPVSAKNLEAIITRLYGFVTRVQKRTATKLVDLVTEQSVTAYINWALSERRIKGSGITATLGCLAAAVRWNPKYKAQDFAWFRPLISQIQPDLESTKLRRKLSKYVPYEDLAKIPELIAAKRDEAAKLGSRQVALLVHDQLLLSWFLNLVWRQRNVRECRIGHNLFKAEIPLIANMAVPAWARERIQANPHELFWQFHFSEDETKTGHEVRAILPRRLIPLLEEYLEHHRPVLLADRICTNLFLNREGTRLTMNQVTDLISTLTLRYAHRRVTPHLFRDIFAYRWLEDHPEGYLTLSKMLWHRDIKTTLRIYGSRFDESHGLCRVEEWLDGLQ
jgi:integrase